MTVELEIQDGSPHWYLSPNIWTVPGDNPEGPVGLPIVGTTCFMWASVRNNGTTSINNAQVRFYWANPSLGFDRNSANYIGNANVSLASGETREVLCLTPWVPTFVNSGHECVLAEAFHPTADPLPPSPVFNVPTDRHVAQRNLSVIMASKSGNMKFFANFSVCNNSRKDRVFQIYSKMGTLEELRALEKNLGGIKIPYGTKNSIENGGFVLQPCPREEHFKTARPTLERFPVEANVCHGLSFVGQLNDEAALVHIIQAVDGTQIGGLSLLILSEKYQQK